jgi:Tol biopolymer transport system component
LLLEAAARQSAGDRYATAGAIADDLRRLARDRPILARRASLFHRATRWCRRYKTLTAMSACLALAVSAGLFAWWQRAGTASPHAPSGGSEIALRLVHRGRGEEHCGDISPDGKRIVYPNWQTGNLEILNLVDSRRHEVTTAGNWKKPGWQYGEKSAWTHDGRRLVYSWYMEGKDQLRVMAADGSGQRVVYETKDRNLWPTSWSGDGRYALSANTDAERRVEFVLVDLQDDSARTLQLLHQLPAFGQQLSPDGRHVVYSRPPTDDETSGDLYLIDTESTDIVNLVKHPAHDYAPYWTPDGRWIVFLSDRTGSTALWAIRFHDGRSLGAARRIFSPPEGIKPKGFDKQGAFYYVAPTRTDNLYTAEVDFENNAVTAAPRKLASRYEGLITSADWSPDGTKLAYAAPKRFQPRLLIRDVQTGDESELRPGPALRRLNRHSYLQWSVSADWLLVVGRDADRPEVVNIFETLAF